MFQGSKLSYYHRLSRGSINYGPMELKVTREKQRETSVEVFEFCHEQNSSSSEFSMNNEVSVGGILKAFKIGASHSSTFATVSARAIEEGKEIKTYQRDFVSEKVEITCKIREDQFLAHYVLVDLYCFTVNGETRQYAHVPHADVLIEPLDKEELRKISQGTFLMEQASWEVVTSKYPSIQLDHIPTLARQLTPLDISHNPHPEVTIIPHVEEYGDMRPFALNEWAGTKSQSCRLEGFEIKTPKGPTLVYMAHLQDIGNTGWTSGFVGTKGQSRRLEGFAIRVAGESAKMWSVRYRAHLEGIGDTAFCKDGKFCGTQGQSRGVEAIFVAIDSLRLV